MLIFFSGPDRFRTQEQAEKVKAAYRAKNPEGSGFFLFDFTDAADLGVVSGGLFQALQETGLFSPKKFIIVRDAFNAADSAQEEIARRLEANPDILSPSAPLVVMFWEGALPRNRKTNALLGFLEKHARMRESFDTLAGPALRRWALARLASIDGQSRLAPAALELLLEQTEGDTGRLDQELRKLAAYRPGGEITAEDIDLFFPVSRTKENVFSALSSLVRGDKRTALLLLERQLDKGENPLGMLGLCAWQLRQLLKITEAYHAEGLRDATGIVRATGVTPLQASQVLRVIGTLPIDRVKNMFAILERLDRDAKTGGLDPTLALTLFVARA